MISDSGDSGDADSNDDIGSPAVVLRSQIDFTDSDFISEPSTPKRTA